MAPKVAIIILNYNGWKDTIECLESVLRNNYSNYQVILIDNDSSNNSMEYIKSWAEGKQKILTPEPSHPLYSLSHPPIKKPIPYIYYTREEAENGGKIELEEKFQNANFQNSTTKYPLIFIQTGENLGFTGGNNVGIKLAIKNGAEYILILNNDVVVEPNFLDPLVKNILNDFKIGIIGPTSYFYYDPQRIFSSGRQKIEFLKGGVKELNLIKNSKEIDALSGCCFLINKKVIDKIGYFYEPYFLNYEETDYCFQAKKAGFKIACEPNSKIWHKVRATLDKIPIHHCYYYYRNKLLFIKRNAPFYIKYPFYIYCSFYLILKSTKYLIKKDKLRASAINNALIDFWKGSFGKKYFNL